MVCRVKPVMTEAHAARVYRSNQHAHDVGFLHDQDLITVDGDFGARPLAEQHAVADLDVDRDQLAGLVTAAGADCGAFDLGGLFLGGVGDNDAALGLLIGATGAVADRMRAGP